MNACRILAFLSLAAGAAVAYAPAVQACTGGGVDRITERTAGLLKGTADLSATGDFDGDGRIDEAFFIRRAGSFSLVVCLDGGNRLVRLVDDIRSMVDRGTRTALPGRYPALCSRGVGPPCRDGELVELELRHEAIEFFEYECCSHLHYWRNETFERFWLSD